MEIQQNAFPVLNLQKLLDLPKGRKSRDMERILYRPRSEDWVTWNFFQIMSGQYTNAWWGHLVRVARRRNAELTLAVDDRPLLTPHFWSTVSSPPEYEAHSRDRIRKSDNSKWVSRARVPKPVEGPSEIDIMFDRDQFLVYVEAKLGSDVSMRTKYDPERNQIIRNIDCLIESARAWNQKPIFWLIVRDVDPTRNYVQLINDYKADPSLLAHALPHRDTEVLRDIAQNLTILLWSDFKECICDPDFGPEIAAVQRELEQRILG